MKTVEKILRKFINCTAIIAVLMLNFSAVMNCKNLVSGEGCCHTQEVIMEKVAPCCIKHLNITTGERISGSCGCSMHEAPNSVDLYNDLYISHNRTTAYQQSGIIIQSAEPDNLTSFVQSYNYSSPPINKSDIFLTNMNLRI